MQGKDVVVAVLPRMDEQSSGWRTGGAAGRADRAVGAPAGSQLAQLLAAAGRAAQHVTIAVVSASSSRPWSLAVGADAQRRIDGGRTRTSWSSATRSAGRTCGATSKPTPTASQRRRRTTARRARCCRPRSRRPVSAASPAPSNRTRRLDRPVLRPRGAGRKRAQLDRNHPRQGLVPDPASLQPAPPVLRQELATERDRTPQRWLTRERINQGGTR